MSMPTAKDCHHRITPHATLQPTPSVVTMRRVRLSARDDFVNQAREDEYMCHANNVIYRYQPRRNLLREFDNVSTERDDVTNIMPRTPRILHPIRPRFSVNADK